MDPSGRSQCESAMATIQQIYYDHPDRRGCYLMRFGTQERWPCRLTIVWLQIFLSQQIEILWGWQYIKAKCAYIFCFRGHQGSSGLVIWIRQTLVWEILELRYLTVWQTHKHFQTFYTLKERLREFCLSSNLIILHERKSTSLYFRCFKSQTSKIIISTLQI